MTSGASAVVSSWGRPAFGSKLLSMRQEASQIDLGLIQVLKPLFSLHFSVACSLAGKTFSCLIRLVALHAVFGLQTLFYLHYFHAICKFYCVH